MGRWLGRSMLCLVVFGTACSGLREPLDKVLLHGGFWEALSLAGIEVPKHIAFVVVDAEVNPEPEFSDSPAAPGLEAVVGAITGVQINRYSFETISLLKQSLENWAHDQPPDADGQHIQTHMIEVAFDSLEDAADRAYFNDLPTSFDLSGEAVDRLIRTARKLLRRSEEFRALVGALGGTVSEPVAAAPDAAPH